MEPQTAMRLSDKTELTPKPAPQQARYTQAALGERALIQSIAGRLPRSGYPAVRLGIGDDCAILSPKSGCEIVVTTDLLLEGRHFRRDWHSAASAGHRCLARGLSDLAAMGATPLAAFLSLAIPADRLAVERIGAKVEAKLGSKLEIKRRKTAPRSTSWVEGFFDGLLALAEKHHVPLAGGDTAQSPHEGVLADIVLLGQTPRHRALRRSTAQPGDRLYVTGTLGGSAAELLAMEHLGGHAASQLADHPQSFPTPRLAVGQALLRRKLATAAIDVSDGLSTDLDHLCEESGLAAMIEASAIPIHPLAQMATEQGWAASPLALALHGGEDYELLFTTSPSTRVPKSIHGVAIHAIGTLQRPSSRTPRLRITSCNQKGKKLTQELQAQGWEHFKKSAPSGK